MKTNLNLPMRPFLKWAGGKRWLVARYGHILPLSCHRYLEPFVGSGAVFFRIRPPRAVLADSNADLIGTYRAIRRDWRAVWRRLREHQRRHCIAYYYQTRGSRPRSDAGRAARFIYLNRTCFNGLYRVNRNGEFNVPKGTKRTVVFPDDDFCAVSAALRRCELRVSDFEPVLDEAGRGDFVYVDPPYTVRHNNNNFVRYNESMFSWQDQVRLAKAMYKAKRRGALIFMSNANASCIRTLYRGFGAMKEVSRCSVLAADSARRRNTTELIVTNIMKVGVEIGLCGKPAKCQSVRST
ncbi:MAG TPA: Dam family site-specific DNA-(adenine-N6)-methyltransferase [Phycisphaerae bacterium]|nr:Dam family site-specific DNA-(adenine-N6)-methyltransferase [Phycisphaerae bacterium]